MSDIPVVSIIITTFSGSEVLDRAIKSVLQQTYRSFEVLVIDDNDPNSDERKKTEIVMENYRIKELKYIKHDKNKNGSAARNTGIRNAKGKYICFLDDDDVFFPTRIEKCVLALEENPQCDSVLTNVLVVDGISVIDVIKQDHHVNPLRDMFFGNPLGTGSNLFLTKKAIENLGGFDESFLRRQDVEFMVRFYEKYSSVYLKESLVVKVVKHRKNVKIDYKKFRDIERHFISKFSHIIHEYLSEEDRKDYLNHTYTVLLKMALVSSSEDVKLAAKELSRIRPLTKMEEVFCLFDKIYRLCRNNRLIYNLKKIYDVNLIKQQASSIVNISFNEENLLHEYAVIERKK